jgi:hypothetical protein
MNNISTSVGKIGRVLSATTAGLIIGLGFIAAAVKFTAVKPDIIDLLDVGRVQFSALHTAEAVLVPLSCLFVAFAGRRSLFLAGATLVCYFAKLILIQPGLHQRMVDRLAGNAPAGGGSHQEYVVVAFLLVMLLFAQVLVPNQSDGRNRTQSI